MHIKKKMLVPVLMLCTILSIFGFAHLFVAFTANAQENLLSANSESIPTKNIVATIHLSSDEPFIFAESSSIAGFDKEEVMSSPKVVTFENVTSIT